MAVHPTRIRPAYDAEKLSGGLDAALQQVVRLRADHPWPGAAMTNAGIVGNPQVEGAVDAATRQGRVVLVGERGLDRRMPSSREISSSDDWGLRTSTKVSHPVAMGWPYREHGEDHRLQLLLVEDDPLIARELTESLDALGHRCTHCATGAAAIGIFVQGAFDAIILDRMLPDVTGTGLLGHLRAQGPVPPVLMLSALGSSRDKVEGLNAGADDYLAKPYDIGELDARLTALVRRGAQIHGDVISLSIGQLRLDGANHKVRFGARHGHLNRIEFSLLLFLMRHADRPVTRTMLLEGVWSYSFQPVTNLVESNISRVRRRLLDLGCDPIVTRRGEGYMLVGDRCL